jgi:predicted O-methyltransferase YrrM
MPINRELAGQYIEALFAQQDEAQVYALEDSQQHGLPAINISPEEGRFIQLLVRASGGTKALEIGTLGGYSGIWIARGLAPGGKLFTLEKDPQHAAVAQEHFHRAGVADLINIRLGDAHISLSALVGEAPFDFVFIDADKSGYPDYYNWAIGHLRIGGIITAHNALRGGAVYDPAHQDTAVQALRAFNQQVANDFRVLSSIFPAGDGTLVAIKIA